jgi:hypothetical protein
MIILLKGRIVYCLDTNKYSYLSYARNSLYLLFNVEAYITKTFKRLA